MKKCGRCKEELPFDKFSKSSKKGYQSYCTQCNRNHKSSWISCNRDKVSNNAKWSRYRLRPNTYRDLLEKQGKRCGICKEIFITTPQIDHDHSCCSGPISCGKCVRGLLCQRCNLLLRGYEVIKSYPGLSEYLGDII